MLPVPVASSVTVTPSTRLPSPSLTVTVTPSRSAPSAVTSFLSPSISERSRLYSPVIKSTPTVGVRPNPFIVALIVLSSATFDEIVPVAIPDASVTTKGCVIVLPVVPRANNTTAAPWTGLLYWSSAVTVTVATSVPLAITVAGTTPIVETARSTSPAVNVIAIISSRSSVSAVARIFLPSAIVDLTDPVATPSVPVTPTGCTTVFPEPETVRPTTTPSTVFPNSSLIVTVMLISSTSSAVAVGLSISIEDVDVSASALSIWTTALSDWRRGGTPSSSEKRSKNDAIKSCL